MNLLIYSLTMLYMYIGYSYYSHAQIPDGTFSYNTKFNLIRFQILVGIH